jgi:hypothetical protein
VKIIRAIARELANLDSLPVDNNYLLKGIIQFIETFGGIELKLDIAPGVDHDNDPNTPLQFPTEYALTQSKDLIILWANPELLAIDEDIRGYPLHTAQNIVHELGHVFDNRTNSQMYQEWETIRLNFALEGGDVLNAIPVETGWDIFANRQNQMDILEFDDCSSVVTSTVCAKLERERLADMFLFWVYNDTPGYSFTSDNPSTLLSDFGIALENFTLGGTWTRTNGTELSSSGFLFWLTQRQL